VKRFDAVIFDMDGTLIEPLIDFAEVREVLGIRREEGILEAIRRMPRDRRSEAMSYLSDIEYAAASRADLLDGAAELCQALRSAGMKTAILTRSDQRALETVLKRFPQLQFDLAWSRQAGPIKPEPDGILRACERLGVRPPRTACVGDFYYDVIAANAAGATSVLLVRGTRPPWTEEADFVIETLYELFGILEV